jgi:hypothetical protein
MAAVSFLRTQGCASNGPVGPRLGAPAGAPGGLARGPGSALRLSLVLGALTLTACAGHADRTKTARSALDARDPQKALSLYNEELEVKTGSELPKEVSGDNALLLLDRSTISQQLTRYEDSSRDLETADKEVEMLDYSRSSAHEIGRYLFSDDVGPYKARPYEKLLVNTLNMLNYLASGQLAGAKVEARRLAVMQKYLAQSEDEPTAALLGPGSYLAGFIFEMAGELSEALLYYEEALKAAEYPSLAAPVRRLLERTGSRSEKLSELAQSAPAETVTGDAGDLLVVVNYGRVPALHAERVPIGLALTYGSLFMDPAGQQAARRLAGQGLVTWVNFPDLDPSAAGYAAPQIQVDGHAFSADTPTQVDDLVRAAYEKAKGPIFASALTRLVARGAIGAGAGVGVGRSSGSSALGMLVALGTQAALTAADTPDTRSWATLPARIAIARVRLGAGSHTVRVSAQGVTREQKVEIPVNGFAVVNLTQLSQH